MKFIVQLSLKISAMNQEVHIPIGVMAKNVQFPQLSDSQGTKERKKANQEALAAKKEIVPEDYFQVEKGESVILEPPGILKILLQKLTAMESRLDEVAKNTMEMKEDIQTVKDDISTMKEDMSTMKEDMSTMKVDILTLKQDSGKMKEDIEEMKEDVSRLRADVNDLGDRMSKMEERSRSSEETLSTAIGMIAFGQEKAAEARISALNANPSLEALLKSMRQDAQAKRLISSSLKQLVKALP